MLVKFQSDESMRGRGFIASYKTLADGCGGRFRAARGFLTSPNYPANYDHDTDCGYLIQVRFFSLRATCRRAFALGPFSREFFSLFFGWLRSLRGSQPHRGHL